MVQHYIEVRKKITFQITNVLHPANSIQKNNLSKTFFRGIRIYFKRILNPYYNSSQPFQKRTTDFEEVKMSAITSKIRSMNV